VVRSRTSASSTAWSTRVFRTAVRADDQGFVLERRREIVTATGNRSVHSDQIRLDRVSPEALEREGAEAGYTPLPRREVPETRDYAGSTVVMLGA